MIDAFDILALEKTFDLDMDQVERCYIAESAKWHPDQAPQASSREKLERTMHMANLNAAYETLKDPLSRGYHLLRYVAPDLKADQEKTIKDPALLMEAMEDQETLDGIVNATEIKAFQSKAQGKCDVTLDAISKAFLSQDYKASMLHLYRYRYYQKVLKDALKKHQHVSTKDSHAASA